MKNSSVAAAALAAAVAAAPMTVEAQRETLLQRGTYLVRTIGACGNCHTAQGPGGPGPELAGGMKFEEKPFTAYAPNITPDKASGIGSWTDAQIINALRNGRRPDGSLIGPPMPIEMYRGLSDNDARAIVAYLRSVKPVANKVPRSEYRMPLPPSYGPEVTKVPDIARTDRVAYGRYLAGPVGHCMECHTPLVKGRRDFGGQLGKGGFPFNGPWGQSISSDITSAGIARYSDAQLRTIIKTGVRPDGTKLKPPMPVNYYAGMTDSDVDAIVAYLRTLK